MIYYRHMNRQLLLKLSNQKTQGVRSKGSNCYCVCLGFFVPKKL